MRFLPSVFAASLLAAAHGAPQSHGVERRETVNERAEFVKDMFKTAFDGYQKYAFPNDLLRPQSNTFANDFGGWACTVVDALGTALIMDLPDVVEAALDYIPKINFGATKDDQAISLFETNIRFIGGLLSAYDLLKGPLSDLAPDDSSKVDALLEQTINLANNLSFAFGTKSGMPYNGLFVHNQSNDGDDRQSMAKVGTLVLEWTRLSDLTGNATYARLTQRAEDYVLNPSPKELVPFPGLSGTDMNVTTGDFLDAAGGWIAGADSGYEYFIKMYVYDPKRFGNYRDRWVQSADSAFQYLVQNPPSRRDLTFLASYNGTTLLTENQHLGCFDGGNFILGGLVLQKQKYINFGIELVLGCEALYNATATGIGPEVFSWNTTDIPANQTDFYLRSGFWIENGVYALRPEVLESFYYAYRATGQERFRDYAWKAIQNIARVTRVGSGYSYIRDVNKPDGGGFLDLQDSFFFAETLKYAYLIFDEDGEFQVQKSEDQDFVFTTEGHPLRVFDNK